MRSFSTSNKFDLKFYHAFGHLETDVLFKDGNAI